MSMVKRIMASCLLLCLVCAAACALAAPTQNFRDFLADEGFDPNDKQVQSHVHFVDQTARAMDVELTVEGMYYDGDTLLIGWKTENLIPEEPALVLYTEVTFDGVPIWADADHPLSFWWPRMFGLFVAGEPINNLMWRFRTEDLERYNLHGEVDVVVYFTVKRPEKPIAVVDPDIHTPYDHEGMEVDRQAMVDAMRTYGVTIAEPGDLDVEAWKEKGYLVLNRYGEHYPKDESEGIAALTGMDMPDTKDQDVSITFRVDLDALAAP